MRFEAPGERPHKQEPSISLPKIEVRWGNLAVNDFRKPTHPEYKDFRGLQWHIEQALARVGCRVASKAYLDDLCVVPDDLPRQGLAARLVHVARDIRSLYSNMKSTFERYRNFYEDTSTLYISIPLRYKGKKVFGREAYTRMECITKVIELASAATRPRVLEVGCGFGGNMLLLDHLCPQMEIFGFEYTNARFASALVTLAGTRMAENLFLGDVTCLPERDAAYDVIFSFHVLEQLGQARAREAVAEMWRVCRLGLVLVEPGTEFGSIFERWRMGKLGYCQNLSVLAGELEGCRMTLVKESACRAWPNTSVLHVFKKASSVS